jgi:hypothetical protein
MQSGNNEFELSPFAHSPLLKKEEQVIILFCNESS